MSIDELISTFHVQMDHTSQSIVAVLTEGKGTPLYIDKKQQQSGIHNNLIACSEDNMDNDY